MVLPIKEQAAELFYGKLFEMDPELKALFKGDMVQQGEKLMTSLNLVVNSLNDLEAVVPALQDLGKRHISYGVTAAHYDTVGGALLWTLEQGLGDAFTDEARAAWTAAYGIVSKTMIDAAY
jgi:hemoglobin-like flavoprotein